MAAVQETVDRVRAIDVDAYKYGFVTDIESDKAAQGPERGHRPLHLGQEGRAGMAARMAAGGLSPLADDGGAELGAGRLSRDRLSGSLLLRRAESDAGAEVARRGRSRAAARPTTSSAFRWSSRRSWPASSGRRVAVDAVFDSVSVATTFKAELAKAGVIFCPFSEAVQNHPELVRKYLGSVVPPTDNFYATLNSAVFSDGSFVYVPPGVRCPMELSTYFRINEQNTGQFERTLIIADKGSYVSYLEGCTAPQRDENQLHAAVVELVALDDAEIKYSTVQNWYPGDAEGKGGIYNFVTKRGDCRGARSKISWTQVETGSAITWKYPSCILRGDDSRGEFYSIAISNGYQQVDSGTKMIHLGRNTSSRIISKGIAAGHSQNTYRGQVSAHRQGDRRAQFHQLRLAADRRPMRRAYRALYRGEERLGRVRARGDDVEDLRGPAVLLPAARAFGRGGDGADRQRLRARRAAATADGIRGRGAEADRDFARRERRLTPPLAHSRLHSCSKSKTSRLHPRQADPRRPEPQGGDRRGRRDHGAERLRQIDAVLCHRRQAGL